jgi:signal peptidase I
MTVTTTRPRRMHWFTEFLLVVVIALVVAALIRAFVAQVFYIPSGSMEDTLHENDWILVSKLSTEFGSVDRGEVVVFADPGSWLDVTPSTNPIRRALEFVGVAPKSTEGDLVKRVIGTGGDHVSCCDAKGRVEVNGQPLNEPYLYPGNVPGDAPAGCSGTFDVTVPAGYLWVMGDHRSVSSDSRCHDGMDRFVPEDLVRGRAVAVIWPLRHWDLLQKPSTFDTVS